MYYGDELGLENVAIPPDRVQDPWEKNEAGLGPGTRSGANADAVGRFAQCGIYHGTPWLPVNPDHGTRNVEVLAAEPAIDPKSISSTNKIATRDTPHCPSGTYARSKPTMTYSHLSEMTVIRVCW